MYDELTAGDIQKMREEIDHRVRVLRPKLIEDVQTARAFGDLSENFEYKCAKQEKNRNESRIRFLENMIRTAVVIPDRAEEGTAGLYDKASAVAPAKPARMRPSYRRRTFWAVCFMIMVWPRVTWPSPAMATWLPFFTARIVVAWVSINVFPRFPCAPCRPLPGAGNAACPASGQPEPWPA